MLAGLLIKLFSYTNNEVLALCTIIVHFFTYHVFKQKCGYHDDIIQYFIYCYWIPVWSPYIKENSQNGKVASYVLLKWF